MNPDLTKFIELCLVDGVISDKEREVIFRKAKELGVPQDECEIILEGMAGELSLKQGSVEPPSINEKPGHFENELTNIKQALSDFEKFLDTLRNFNDSFEKVQMKWFTEEFKGFLKEFPFSGDLELLNQLIAIPKRGITNNRSSIERINSKRIQSILSREEFFGFYKFCGGNALRKKEISEYIQKHTVSDKDSLDTFLLRERYKWITYLWTSKGVHILTEFGDKVWSGMRSDRDDVKKGFYSYQELILHPNTYENMFSTFTHVVQTRFFASKGLRLSNLMRSLRIEILDDTFDKFLSNSKLKKEELENILRVNNHIQREVRNYNNELNTIHSDFLYSIDEYLKGEKPAVIFHQIYDNFTVVNKVIENHKEFLLYLTSLYRYRDTFLNHIINGEVAYSHKLYLQLEDLGVFQTHFQRGVIDGMQALNESLIQINESLQLVNNSLIEGFASVAQGLEQMNQTLSSLDSKSGYSNLISTIQSYQLYKINKNTKSLRF